VKKIAQTHGPQGVFVFHITIRFRNTQPLNARLKVDASHRHANMTPHSAAQEHSVDLILKMKVDVMEFGRFLHAADLRRKRLREKVAVPNTRRYIGITCI
jgi:hypothetical protein